MASLVTKHPEFVSLLQLVAGQGHIMAVVLTCGLRRVWEKVLDREGLAHSVKVIGGGRIADGFVVTSEVKPALVGHLRHTYHMPVFATGDSELDLGMMSKAHEAIVVVGVKHTRSQAVDAVLRSAIDKDGLRATQVLLPRISPPAPPAPA